MQWRKVFLYHTWSTTGLHIAHGTTRYGLLPKSLALAKLSVKAELQAGPLSGESAADALADALMKPSTTLVRTMRRHSRSPL